MITEALQLPVVLIDRWGARAPKGGIVIAAKTYRGGQFCPNAPADVPAVATSIDSKLATPTRTSIAGFVYTVRPITIHPEVGSVAFAMDRPDTGSSYAIHRDIHGEICCTCPDFTFKRAGTGNPCKHGQALVDLGLIPASTPYVLAPFASRPAPISTPARRRRFEPTAEDNALAAAMFA